MRKFLIAAPLALAAAATLATPASAAPGMRGGWQIGKEISQLERQVERAQQRRLISWNEATRLHRQVDQLQNLHTRYARGGFTNAELRILDNRIDNVKRQLRFERFDRNDRRR